MNSISTHQSVLCQFVKQKTIVIQLYHTEYLCQGAWCSTGNAYLLKLGSNGTRIYGSYVETSRGIYLRCWRKAIHHSRNGNRVWHSCECCLWDHLLDTAHFLKENGSEFLLSAVIIYFSIFAWRHLIGFAENLIEVNRISDTNHIRNFGNRFICFY